MIKTLARSLAIVLTLHARSAAPASPSLTVPLECVDAVYIMQPGAQCNPLPGGKLRCSGFDVQFHCWKVKSETPR